MKCDEIRLEEFHDGELAPAEAAAVREHVAACADCARALDELRRLEALLRSAPAGGPGEGYVERVRERLHAPRARWMALIPMAAAAALLIALARLTAVPAPPVDTAALVEEYASAPPAARAGIERRIRQGGPGAVAALKALVRDRSADPRVQAAAGVLLARISPDNIGWILATVPEPQADPVEWELTEIGAEPTDNELIGYAFEVLRADRTREEGLAILRKLSRGGANREAHALIVGRVKDLLGSPSPAEQETGLAATESLEIKFLLPDLIDLLDAPVIGEKALRFLREQTRRDFGTDKEAWRRLLDRRM